MPSFAGASSPTAEAEGRAELGTSIDAIPLFDQTPASMAACG